MMNATYTHPECVFESLRRHLLWLREQTLKQGWGTAEWSFPTAGNTPLDQSRATKAFHRAGAEAKLPSHVLYDCRHTFVCLMLMGGAKLGYTKRGPVQSRPPRLSAYLPVTARSVYALAA